MAKEFFFKSDKLVIWRPTGTLNTQKILDFINFINQYCRTNDPHFCRLVDLCHITGISLSFKDLYPIAKQRNSFYNENITKNVKMAFLVKNPMTYGMARMYIMMTSDSHIEMDIFKTIEEVSDFLELEISEITV